MNKNDTDHISKGLCPCFQECLTIMKNVQTSSRHLDILTGAWGLIGKVLIDLFYLQFFFYFFFLFFLHWQIVSGQTVCTFAAAVQCVCVRVCACVCVFFACIFLAPKCTSLLLFILNLICHIVAYPSLCLCMPTLLVQ